MRLLGSVSSVSSISSISISGILLLCSAVAFAGPSPLPADDHGSVVIVFKDGHRQMFPASTISAMEFRSAAGVTTPISIPEIVVPGRGRFLGKWLVGEGNGDTFYITLEENGEASKSIGSAHGTWTYVDGEARVSWDDGWHDAIRKVGSKYQKYAYGPGKSFSDTPDNVTEASNTTPKPI